ncbi:MAG: hypothetical protein J4F36_12370 [Nitrosopumilaceae archaeon]|nr:hypothetical protein [Nitrosopumilaceae archaeon]
MAAYFPLRPLTKNAVAIPPNTPADSIKAPRTPSAANIGVPEPVLGFSLAILTRSSESLR